MSRLKVTKFFYFVAVLLFLLRSTSGQSSSLAPLFLGNPGATTSDGGPYRLTAIAGGTQAGISSGGEFRLHGGLSPVTIQLPMASGPTLVLEVADGVVVVSWTPDTPGYALEQTEEVFSGPWTDTGTGATNPVRLSAGPSARFFRLVQH